MKSPSGAPARVILIVLFSHLFIVSDGSPIRDGLSDIWVDTTLKKFYGPWPSLRKANGQDVDYGDYGVVLPEVVDGATGDFPSNYEFGDSDVLFAPSAVDQSGSVGKAGDADQNEDPNDLDNRDYNGNVAWTSAAM
ncbi:uncharacterized protein LOC125500337 isoform X2 [Athalia rosae]|uniref:uncharacterized protein LOC125500337 isoform X2 n=1 Tax=Athalia rosae TaxID=37344 RepID=UPI002034A1DF|nr:uncharacterized protein LOC125500337 isoform X2 [Athalia rosae]